jgi:hypothetical protein
MKINVGQLLNSYEVYQLQKYLKNGKPRTATLILYLACRKAYPDINLDQLYKACWKKILAKIDIPSQPERQLKLLSA